MQHEYTHPLIFARETKNDMAQELQPTKHDKEFGKNWVTTSRFMFYMQLFALLAFVGGCSCQLYKATRFESKPRVEVPESTQYTPVYK
jgi:hypothetical protein